ncbi:MAG TPA: glycosyltransferase family 2 protein [Terriglobales bacterium]|nr:glycosyltransferase family 2 protein [Terriglobales bacterium]
MTNSPLVSVVTPFYNTHEYLAECIESVLAQTCQDFEYILIDNQSNDGSSEIAQSYATRFPEKVRVVRTASFLSQVENYNFALTCISANSKYCKMVQADDWIFADCLTRMIEVAEAHPSVGIVAAYQLEGENIGLDGLPWPGAEVSGREACRRYYLKRQYLFGTPTSLMMRSDMVRSRNPFYDERYAPFEDAHVCFDLLKSWSFGFVHELLTFSRTQDESILAGVRPFGGMLLFRLAVVVAHGRDYLSAEEYDRCLKDAERPYFLFLGASALKRKSKEFWAFHRRGLSSINYSLDQWFLTKWRVRAAFEHIGNPKRTLESIWGGANHSTLGTP